MDLIVNNGKVEEPSLVKKTIAKMANDTEAVIILSFEDIQKMVVEKIHYETPWLQDYEQASLDFDPKYNSFTITFTK